MVMSFNEMFAPLLGRSHQLAYRLLGDDDAAGEVASEAMARLFEHWDTLGHDPDHCTAWTLRVTRNLCVDALRRRFRETGLPDEDLASVTTSELALRLAVLDAVRELPERQRRVVELRYLLDLSQADTAAALGVHPGTVAAHTSRALSRLRRALDARPQRSHPTAGEERTTMKVTSVDQARSLLGTNHPVSARITGTADRGNLAADIGIPAVYRGRGQGTGPARGSGSLVGEEFDCVVVDIDDDQRPVVTNALGDEAAAEFARRQEQVRDLRIGQHARGRVGVVTPIGAFVDFSGLRGLVHSSELDPAAPLTAGQDVDIEVVDTDPMLARISLRIAG